jgi:hypothetical protein
MSVAESSGHEFSIGRVVGHTFGVIARNFVTIGVLALLLVVPLFVLDFVSSQATMGSAENVANPFQLGIGAIVSVILYLVMALVMQAAIMYATVRDLNKQPVRFGEAVSTGLKHIVPLFLIGLVSTLGMTLGLILLIVPGIILALMWVVSAPTRVVENTGVFESLGRSRELTSGHRWAIFGLLVMYALLVFALSMAITPFWFQIMQAMATGTLSTGTLVLYSAVNSILGMLQIVIGSSGIAAIYYELRTSKEGIGPEALAAVFD